MSDTQSHDVIPMQREIVPPSEVLALIDQARRNPRDIEKVLEQSIAMATADQETAGSCFYTLKRFDRETNEDKIITGPSIRLAEIMYYTWRNLRAAAGVVDDTGSVIIGRSYVHDLETNNALVIDVRRNVVTRNGKRFSPDMVTVTGNAAVSFAFRNAIFRIIPKSYVDKVEKEARRVAVGDQKTIEQRRRDLISWASKMGISKERVFQQLNVTKIEGIGSNEIEIALGLYTAVREGTVDIDDAFPKVVENTDLPLPESKNVGESVPNNKMEKENIKEEPVRNPIPSILSTPTEDKDVKTQIAELEKQKEAMEKKLNETKTTRPKSKPKPEGIKPPVLMEDQLQNDFPEPPTGKRSG
jgi:hypothetical protein